MITSNIDIARKIAADNYLLSRESLREFSNILVMKKCRKGEMILNEGDVCKWMIYVEKGMLRQYYYKYDKDLTEHISYEGGIIICIESYFKEEPTRLLVEALENSVIWYIPKNNLEDIAQKHPDIEGLYRMFLEKSLIESQIKADTLRFEPANERYIKLSKRHPEILKRAPLVYIASLLQMTPETLSRVRSSLL